MYRETVWAGVVLTMVTVSVVAEPDLHADLALTLRRVGERVERHFARAQSIICLEVVHLQPLGIGLSPDGFARRVESELRVSWDSLTDLVSPPEAQMLRQVLRINGHPPRSKDPTARHQSRFRQRLTHCRCYFRDTGANTPLRSLPSAEWIIARRSFSTTK